MKDDTEKNAGAVRKYAEQGPDGLFFATPLESGEGGWRASAPASAGPKPFDFWVALDILAHRWYWLFLGALLCAAGFFYLGYNFIKPKFTASAQLLRSETPEFFKSTQLTPETFAGLIRSPDLLRTVGEQAKPPIPADRLLKCIKIDPEPDSDLVKVMLAAPDPQEAVELLNIYLRESVAFTKQLQTEQAAQIVNDYLKQQVDKMNEDINSLHQEFRGKANSALAAKVQEVGGNLTAIATNLNASRPPLILLQRLKELRERLDKSLLELHELQDKFTEKHPKVIVQEEQVADLSKQYDDLVAKTGETNVDFSAAAVAATRPANTPDPEADIIRIRLLSVEEARVDLVRKLRQAELYATNPPGMAQIFAPATARTVQSNMRGLKIGLVSIFGGATGIGLGLVLLGLVELNDGRMRSRDDLQRVTRLPLLTTLKDLRGMNAAERSQWAFRTWTILQGRLSPSPNHGLVCGITSSSAGEGRSTWISLLAEAASLTGFRVLTIATRPSPTHQTEDDDVEVEPAAEEQVVPEKHHAETNGASKPANGAALQTNVLTSPAKVTEQLTGPNSQPVVHIPLPGWVWNLERRKQWREALSHWRSIDNLVILVELPPASVPEAVLLGSNLPNLLWLADCGTADAGATREQLEILRHARCNLIGSVFNREGSTSFRRRFPRWLGCAAVLAAVSLGSANVRAAGIEPPSGTAGSPVAAVEPATDTRQPNEEPVPAASGAAEDTLAGNSTNVSFSIVNPAQRAAWQQHLTLGPGDVVSLGLYGAPELAQPEVTIGPDGRVSYLEAQDVLATGLTIDEFRSRLDKELAQYRRAPRTFVSPVAFRSKRYYMLGKVMTKGVYVLDRPITVLEAIARAHGLENGLVDRNVIDLADFQRSFLARSGKRYPLNFEKLFQGGDLSQNIAIEPGDYLYFPSTTVKEVYVVGEVRLPGTVVYSPDLTIIGAISARGGYTDRAYRARVLVVRGSLNHPERFAVDTHAILDGRSRDFQLQPRDIIYVNSRPFIRVEELADLAATAFVQSLITTWVGVDVVKPINQ